MYVTNDIEVDSVTKRFGETVAVDNVSFSVRKGELFGLLGPNGAGKTTLTSMINGMLNPTSGTIKVAGYDIQKHPFKVKELLGVIPQEIVLYDYMNARENLAFFGNMYGLSGQQLRGRIDELLGFIQLDEKFLKRHISTYSGGMKRRINIAAALLHDPQVILMDEPTAGLDPQNRHALWDIIQSLNKKGKTIVLTTHLMDEAEELCHRVAIMDHGRIIVLGTPRNLINKIDIEDTITVLPDKVTEEQISVIQKVPGVRIVKRIYDEDEKHEKLKVIASKAEDILPDVIAAVLSTGTKIRSIQLTPVTLEDVFIEMTGCSLREQEGLT